MGRGFPWWIRPFVGSIVAIVGLFAIPVVLYLVAGTPSCDLQLKLDRPLLPFPPDRRPDLDIAPGGPGYVASLGMGGHQFHYEDKEAKQTWIAVDAWLLDQPCRIAVAGYDGPPNRELVPSLVRPLDPLLPMLVVRVEGGGGVWWADEAPNVHGPARAEAGELNLFVVPGKLSLWTGDGPRHEIEVTGAETVWCTLGPGGLSIDHRD